MKRVPQAVRAAAAVVAVEDSAVVVAGAAIGAAVAVVAADAEIAGNRNRVFATRAAGLVGMPRFFLRPESNAAVCARRACRSRISCSSGLAFRAY
jgi:hypothetical protein